MTLKEKLYTTAVDYANAEVDLALAPTASNTWRAARKLAQQKWELFEYAVEQITENKTGQITEDTVMLRG